MGRSNDLLCLVTLPDSYILAINTQKTFRCSVVFDEICQKLKIVQKDFFGLQVKDDKYCTRWLNLRNQFSIEVNCSCPVKLVFLIKYFVPPHYLLQDSTRDVFYKITRNAFLSDQFNFREDFANETAAILHHCTDINNNNDVNNINNMNNDDVNDILPPSCANSTRLGAIKAISSTMNVANIAEAKRLFLMKLSHHMPTVGHTYSATVGSSHMELCVLHSGLASLNEKLEIISNRPWSAIRQATHIGCDVTIHFVTSESLVLTMKNKAMANAFYRDLTEVCTFFHCDTVGDVIMDQTNRDFKGTIVSLFNENSNYGKAYVFDIEHTLKETIDLIRRHIYHKTEKPPLPWSNECGKPPTSDIRKVPSPCDCEAQEYLNKMRELFTCNLCVEHLIDTAFVPCGHIFSCKKCSVKITKCPLCKNSISSVQHVYLPHFSLLSISSD